MRFLEAAELRHGQRPLKAPKNTFGNVGEKCAKGFKSLEKAQKCSL
jgi:hypothetical protein